MPQKLQRFRFPKKWPKSAKILEEMGRGTMGCHPMVSYAENANFVTDARTGDLSTVNVQPRYSHHTCSVHKWIGNSILHQSPTTLTSVSYIYISLLHLIHLLHILHQSPTSISYISYISLLHLLRLLRQPPTYDKW